MQFAGADKIGGDGAAAAAEAAEKRKRKNTDKAAKTTNSQLKEGALPRLERAPAAILRTRRQTMSLRRAVRCATASVIESAKSTG